jgi:hypothetical protein
MLDHLLGPGRQPASPPEATHDARLARPVTFRERVEACRRAHLALPQATRSGSVQVVELGRIRLRLARRWAELRPRVLAVVEAGLARGLGPDDLCVRVGEDHLYVLRVGADRRELERRGELLAAEATARLCGTIPGGVAIRVRTLAFDLDDGLADLAGPEELHRRIENPSGPANGGTAAKLDELVAGLQPRFRPIFNLRKRLVSAYQLAAFVRDTGGGSSPASPLDPDLLEDDVRAELDCWSLRQAIRALGPPSGGGLGRGLIVPVRYPTLAVMRPRASFTGLCRQLPLSSGRRLLFEVLDLPPGLPQARVRELMAYVRPFCRAIVVRLPADAADAGHLASSGIGALSLAAASLGFGDEARARRLADFAGAARTLHLRSLLVEADSERLCRVALAAGIGHVGGDALLPPLPRPGGAFTAHGHG